MKKILRNIFLSILAIIVAAIVGVWYTLFGVSEKPVADKYIVDSYGTTYLAITDKEGVTYAVVTDADGKQQAAKFENGYVGEINTEIKVDVDPEEIPTNYTGPDINVEINPDDYTGAVSTTIPTTGNTDEPATSGSKPQKPGSTTTTSASTEKDPYRLEPFRIKQYHKAISSGTFLMETTMEDEELGSTPVVMAVKNGNTYVETSMSSEGINLDAKVIYIKSTKTTYLIIDNWKKYTKLPAELMGDTDGLDMAGELQNSYSEDDLKNVKVSEVEIGGKKLILESYNSGGTTVNYYFDGDKLIRRDDVYSDGTVSSTVFKRFTTNVPDSYFEVPEGYGYLNLSWLESLGAFE